VGWLRWLERRWPGNNEVRRRPSNLASAAGLDWLAVDSLSEAELERRLLAKPERRCHYVMPDYGRVHQQLQRKGMTLMLLWEKYQAEHAGEQTYRYTQFCKYYGQFARGLKRSMRQIHRAGEKLLMSDSLRQTKTSTKKEKQKAEPS
jgi:transposase